jgi:hypothetical protein
VRENFRSLKNANTATTYTAKKIIQHTWPGNDATPVSQKMKESCGENEGTHRSEAETELVEQAIVY